MAKCKLARCGWTSFIEGFRYRAEAICEAVEHVTNEHAAACITYALDSLDDDEQGHVEDAHDQDFANLINGIGEAGVRGALALLA